MRRVILCLSIAAAPACAEPDIFARLTGTFGTDLGGEDSCAVNPMSQVFSADGTRLLFHWARPYASVFGGLIVDQGSSVLSSDGSSITLRLDPENRLATDGALLRFTYFLVPGLDGYCLGTGPREGVSCLRIYHRCPGAAPTS